MSKRDKVMA